MASASLFERNQSFIVEHAPHLQSLCQRSPDPRVHVEQTRKEGYTLRFENRYVHSRYDPLKEARRLLTDTTLTSGCLLVIFGFGTGWLLEAVDLPPESRVLVFEPSPEIARAALEVVDLGRLLTSKRARLYVTESDLAAALKEEVDHQRDLFVLLNPFHKKFFPEACSATLTRLKLERNRAGLHQAAKEKGFRLFLASTLFSMTRHQAEPALSGFQNALLGKPAVIAAAGPSLDKNLADLIPFRDRCVLFAMARSAPVLERHGLYPDFLVHTEAQDFHFLIENLSNLKNTIFLLADQCRASFYDFPHGRTIVYQNPANQVSQTLIKELPAAAKGFLPTAGSVATEAFAAAVFMGCRSVTIIGQDLAYQPGRYYAVAPLNQAIPHGDKEKRATKGYFGGRVPTLANYLHFIDWYTDSAKHFRNQIKTLKLYNATEGGAFIDGFEHRKLRDIAHQDFTQNINLNALLAPHFKQALKSRPRPESVEKVVRAWQSALTELIAETKKIGTLVDQYRDLQNDQNLNAVKRVLQKCGHSISRVPFIEVFAPSPAPHQTDDLPTQLLQSSTRLQALGLAAEEVYGYLSQTRAPASDMDLHDRIET